MQTTFSFLQNADSFQLSEWACKKASFIRDSGNLVIKKETYNTFKYIPLDEYELQTEDDWRLSQRGVQREGVIFELQDDKTTIRHKRDCIAIEIQHLVKGEIEDIVACTHKATRKLRLLVLAKDKKTGCFQLTVFQKK